MRSSPGVDPRVKPTPIFLAEASDDASTMRRPCGGCGDGIDPGFAFTFAFQPIVDVAKRTVIAQEALVRGLDGAESDSVISRVNDDNRYRFDQACRVKAVQMAKQLGIDHRGEMLSINFLPNAVYNPEACLRTTLQAAREANFPLDRILFEVAEVERVADRSHLRNIMVAYKRHGFVTAIDDFGAGYSGLNLLSDYQPDLLKVDMNLVRGIALDRPRQAIVRGIVSVAAELNIRVIAEGVETISERDTLRTLGIHLMQGYLFARPAFESLARVNW